MYEWFIEPQDAYTNRVISEHLPLGEFSEILCADGIRRGMWVCEHEFVGKIEASREQLRLLFRVYNRSGPQRPAREWKFGKRKGYTKTVKKKREVVDVPF